MRSQKWIRLVTISCYGFFLWEVAAFNYFCVGLAGPVIKDYYESNQIGRFGSPDLFEITFAKLIKNPIPSFLMFLGKYQAASAYLIIAFLGSVLIAWPYIKRKSIANGSLFLLAICIMIFRYIVFNSVKGNVLQIMK